jgi:hypothetical protein
MTPEIAEFKSVPEGVLITYEDRHGAICPPVLLYQILSIDRPVAVEGESESLGLSPSKQTESPVTRTFS